MTGASSGLPPPPRSNSGLLHVCTGGSQHKAQEENWLISGPPPPQSPVPAECEGGCGGGGGVIPGVHGVWSTRRRGLGSGGLWGTCSETEGRGGGMQWEGVGVQWCAGDCMGDGHAGGGRGAADHRYRVGTWYPAMGRVASNTSCRHPCPPWGSYNLMYRCGGPHRITHTHTIEARRTGVTNRALHRSLTNLVRP